MFFLIDKKNTKIKPTRLDHRFFGRANKSPVDGRDTKNGRAP
jgi:hypothetical protein